jgi:hypothetical protein
LIDSVSDTFASSSGAKKRKTVKEVLDDGSVTVSTFFQWWQKEDLSLPGI